jgi:hypothetical protein
MPRRARLDAAGALQDIIGRGIQRCRIYRNVLDRQDFLSRLWANVDGLFLNALLMKSVRSHPHQTKQEYSQRHALNLGSTGRHRPGHITGSFLQVENAPNILSPRLKMI